jgi:hypothetical protein
MLALDGEDDRLRGTVATSLGQIQGGGRNPGGFESAKWSSVAVRQAATKALEAIGSRK